MLTSNNDRNRCWYIWTQGKERVGGQLATETTVNLIADISYAKVPMCAVAIIKALLDACHLVQAR